MTKTELKEIIHEAINEVMAEMYETNEITFEETDKKASDAPKKTKKAKKAPEAPKAPAKSDLDQSGDRKIGPEDAVIAAKKAKIAATAKSPNAEKDAAFYKKVQGIVNRRLGHPV